MAKKTYRIRPLSENSIAKDAKTDKKQQFDDDEPIGGLKTTKVSFIGLFRFASGWDKFWTLVGIFLSISAGMIQCIHVCYSGYLVNFLMEFEKSHDLEKLWSNGKMLVAMNIGTCLLLSVIAFFLVFIFRTVCINITDRLRIRFLESLLKQDAEWYDVQKFGALNTQLNENVEYVRAGLGEKVDILFRFIAISGTMAGVSFYLDWRTSLSMVIILPLSALTTLIMSKMVESTTKRQLKEAEDAGAILQESVINVRTVQSCNAQSTMIDRYRQALRKSRRFNILSHIWHGGLFGFFFLIIYVCSGIGLYYGATRVATEGLSIGVIYTVVRGLLWSGYIVGILNPHIMFIAKAKAAAETIYGVIDRRPKIDASFTDGKNLGKVKGRIQFSEVHFSYPSRRNKKILDGLSWTAEPGETVAFVGHSGSGKSTCISLLTRLYECTAGMVSIDGIDVREVNIRSLRNTIGVVQQEPILFAGTIAENITLSHSGLDEANRQRLESICRQANAHEFIEKLFDGYETKIGVGGVQLSGGQKQRVAIARTLYNNPSILLLDEATSALDAESEVKVQEALQHASKGRTTIVIAHRLSTLRNADKIVVIDKGRVIETGTHAELTAHPDSFYANLVKAQQFSKESKAKVEEEMESPEKQQFVPQPGRFRTETRGSAFSTAVSMVSAATNLVVEVVKRRIKNTNSGLLRLYRNCDGNYFQIIFSVIILFLRSSEVIFIELVFLYFYNTYIDYDPKDPQKFLDEAKWPALGLIVEGLLLFPIIFETITVLGCCSERVADNLRIRALESVLDQDAVFFDQQQTSNAKVIQRIATDSIVAKGGLDVRFYYVVNNGIGMIQLLLVTAFFSWQTTLTGILICIVEVLLLMYFGERMQTILHEVRLSDESSKVAVEIIEGARTMQLLCKEQYFLEKYAEKLREIKRKKIKAAVYEGFVYSVARGFVYLYNSFSYGLGIYYIANGISSPASIFVASQLLNQSSDNMIYVAFYMNEFFKAGYAADSLFELIESKSEIRGRAGNLETEVVGDVELRKVDFAYPSRPNVNVADGLSLLASRGESIALVGPSGGGKSTAINLLLRFYEPNAGKVKIDRIDLRSFGMEYMRSQMALVGQEPVLFRGTIAENIRLGCQPEPTMDEIKEACQIANAAPFIEQLPMGYDTEVGEKGAQLSGGQKQRIAIARAIVRKPKILLLDEATSALDAQSEKAVQQALEKASLGRTCITIAHRLSSIQYCNRIYFIRNGRVVEYGSHAELAANPDSQYAQLLEKQKLNTPTSS